tara:strand:+ start:156 stop:2399 length:2244 start_codon:yes stop_codon:yes gene_type:complete
MTVTALVTRNDITATASQTSFTYTFRVLAATDMDVYQNGVLLSSGYTVNDVGNTTGGTVVLDSGVPVGQIVSLVLAMPLDRTTNYQNSGKFLADDVNEDFDKIYIGAVQNENEGGRSLRLKDVEPPTAGVDMTIPLKDDRKGKFLSFNATTGAPEASSLASQYDSTAWSVYDFTGNGSTTAFTLGSDPASENNTQVYIDGVYQQKDGYSVSGTVLTFSVAPPNLSTIEVMVATVQAVGSTSSDLVSYTPAGTGAVATTVQTKLRETVSVKDFGAVGDGEKDDTAAIQAAIDSLGNSGGTVLIPVGTYLISSTLNLTKKTTLTGEGGYFLNQYSNTDFTVGGTTIKLKTGSNTDMLKVQVDSASIGDDYRSHCSIRNIQFFGNRSEAQLPSTRDNNTSGNGIVLSGVRYVTFENVIVIKCAEDGIVVQSHDYGSGAISSNNLLIRGCSLLSNYGKGISAAGGDSVMLGCNIGYNGSSGISASGFGLINNCLVWDNLGAGVFIASTTEAPVLVGNKIYDNDLSGINIGSTDGRAVITGNMILRNGGGSTSGVQNKSGIFIASTLTNGIVISGNEIGNNTGTTQEYGVYFNSSATRVEGFSGNNIYGNATANITLATTDNIRLHESIGTATPKHPGFLAEGNINLNGNALEGFNLNSSPDASSSSVAITTSPVGLFSGATNGAVYMVFITHTGGSAGGWAVISGDSSTPLILTQDSSGSPTYTFSISGTSVQVATSSSALTSTWKMYRVV